MELKILIVDDDWKLLSVLKEVLAEENHFVKSCSDGRKAIEICQEEKFDLIISDLMMPGANGLEVLKETRKIDPECLVVLITGFASLETAVQAIREGAYDYITKPFKLDEIKIVVNNASEKIRLIRENKKLLHKLHEAYEQLRLMKAIIDNGGESGVQQEKAKSEGDDKSPFIAGSMLPFYYSTNRTEFGPSVISDLERISGLREKGLLTDEEYDLCKSKLIKNIKH
jgi:DNA-binding response OmpR family regulator